MTLKIQLLTYISHFKNTSSCTIDDSHDEGPFYVAYVRLKKYNQLTTLVILNILYLEQLMNDSHDEGPFYVAYSHHLRDFKNHSELKYDTTYI